MNKRPEPICAVDLLCNQHTESQECNRAFKLQTRKSNLYPNLKGRKWQKWVLIHVCQNPKFSFLLPWMFPDKGYNLLPSLKLLLLKWDYNIITFIPSLFFQTTPYTIPCSLPLQIPKHSCSLHIMLIMTAFSRLTFWHKTTSHAWFWNPR